MKVHPSFLAAAAAALARVTAAAFSFLAMFARMLEASVALAFFSEPPRALGRVRGCCEGGSFLAAASATLARVMAAALSFLAMSARVLAATLALAFVHEPPRVT